MELLDQCKQLEEICRTGDAERWADLFAYFKQKIIDGESQEAKRELKSIFGGMGSFNDLILQKNGQILDSNARLQELRSELFDTIYSLK